MNEIAADSHVNVALQKDHEYASVCGRARVLRDRAKLDDLWNEQLRVYFPTGKDDPDLALIKVRPEEGEYWDHGSAQGIKYLFEAATSGNPSPATSGNPSPATSGNPSPATR